MSALGVEGGAPVRTTPFPAWPFFSDDALQASEAVLRSGNVNYWTGEEGRQFEAEFASYAGCEHGIAVANGTVALELCLRALGVGAGDEVVVPSRTFIASASCAAMCGATPRVADVDRDSQNVTAATIAATLTERTRAIVAVHLAGWPCDMDSILALARQRGLWVIEDCAQALGAQYRGRPVGSMGDMAAFSFCQDKIMTTGGEGGMVVTRDPTRFEVAWSFKDHGKSYDAVYRREHAPGFRWLHEQFGTNWRMTEMQAAIGRAQLPSLSNWVEQRRTNAAQLHECCARIPALRVAVPPPDVRHAYYRYYVFVRPEALKPGWSRDRIREAIVAEGVPCFTGSCSEIYRELAFPPHLRPAGRLPVAKELGETSLAFLVHPTLTTAEIADTCRAIEKVTECGAR